MGNERFKVTVAFMVLMLVGSCNSRSFETTSELRAYVRDSGNGYHLTKTVNDISYALTYKPTDILVKQELGNTYTNDDIVRLRRKYGDYLYFNLSLSANGQELLNKKAGNRNNFGALVNDLAFGMEEKVHLISQKRDTIPLMDYVYPRMYGSSQTTDILLVYPRDEKLLGGDYLLLSVGDLGFGTGEVGFKIKTNALVKEPGLNLNSI